jgi:SEC-C motif-containing protein
MQKPCPCTSGRPYVSCCAPFHRGEREAETPQALMRSRFAAFATGDAEYLWRTLHPDHDDRALPKEELLRSLKEATRAHKYMRLAILDAKDARVLFLAGVFERGVDRSFVELSTFAREGEGWRYLCGEARDARGLTAKEIERLTIDSFGARGT